MQKWTLQQTLMLILARYYRADDDLHFPRDHVYTTSSRYREIRRRRGLYSVSEATRQPPGSPPPVVTTTGGRGFSEQRGAIPMESVTGSDSGFRYRAHEDNAATRDFNWTRMKGCM